MATNVARKRAKKWEERKERSRHTRTALSELTDAIKALRSSYPRTATSHTIEDKDKRFTKFSDLPLSGRTLEGLARGNYEHLTTIQQEALPHALVGRDVLGAAKTGSGKTLCFVAPVLERLYQLQWDGNAGLGALILSPTRELALQIFRVLQVVGYKHTFSAALLTGGRNVAEERKRLDTINIAVGTPGRLLHHLSESGAQGEGIGLLVDNLAMLCLDEADRLLDMGFKPTIEGILEQLPPATSRQTLLFSATQTRDVRMLAQLCGGREGDDDDEEEGAKAAADSGSEEEEAEQDGVEAVARRKPLPPVFVADHAMTAAPTPMRACQNFMIVDLHRKLDALYVFLKRHPNDKTVVFINTCNQVKFMYLAFAKLLKDVRLPCMCLTGKMKQFRREEVFLTFSRCRAAVLFCTDIAARGLDFPLVHWVVQYDCPESVQTYIHRVGRTARAGAKGAGILMLSPEEAPFLAHLHHKLVPVREIAMRPQFAKQEMKHIFMSLCVQGLKYDAQKAVISYLRSIHFASNKDVFKLENIDVERFAQSCGLLTAPDTSELTESRSSKNLPWDVLNFIAANKRKLEKAALKKKARGEAPADEADGEKDGDDEDDDEGPKTKRQRHLEAADLFNTLQTKQRFNANSVFKDLGPVGDDDDVLVKKGSTAAAVADKEESRHLTPAERLAGASENKKKKYLNKRGEADLRIKEVFGLSSHQRFSDSDEDEVAGGDGEKGTAAENSAPTNKTKKAKKSQALSTALAHHAPSHAVVPTTEGENASAEEAALKASYVAQLGAELAGTKEADRGQFKDLRKQRQRKRLGKDRDNEDAHQGGGVVLGRPSDDDESDGDDSGGQQHDFSEDDDDDDGEMAAMLREVEKLDDGGGASSDDEEAPPQRSQQRGKSGSGKKAPMKKRRLH